MDKDVYGYLLLTENSLGKAEAVRRDYLHSMAVMAEENKAKCKNYVCCIVCVGCSWWYRRKIAKKIGVPMKRIAGVKYLEAPSDCYNGFNIIVAADSMVDMTFFGRTKVYDSQSNVPREKINPCIEVVYDV